MALFLLFKKNVIVRFSMIFTQVVSSICNQDIKIHIIRCIFTKTPPTARGMKFLNLVFDWNVLRLINLILPTQLIQLNCYTPTDAAPQFI